TPDADVAPRTDRMRGDQARQVGAPGHAQHEHLRRRQPAEGLDRAAGRVGQVDRVAYLVDKELLAVARPGELLRLLRPDPERAAGGRVPDPGHLLIVGPR